MSWQKTIFYISLPFAPLLATPALGLHFLLSPCHEQFELAMQALRPLIRHALLLAHSALPKIKLINSHKF